LIMLPTPWFERKFNFSYTENIFPCLLERLGGTPLRVAHKLTGTGGPAMTAKPDGKWSVLEQVGHLADVEPLWQQRIRDFLAGAETLTAADLQNRKTHEAGHNARSAKELIDRFAAERSKTLSMLHDIDEAGAFRTALHPRLRTPMRLMDHALFVAEHDDHHLAHITHLLTQR
jgi:uncharacterized damage-inducible protein DinB